MAKVTLTDQLGAMKCVDELRHAQIAVDEHLDLGARRAEVARHVTQYYSQNGIAVQPELVERGVRAYFDRRLTFEAPALSRFENWLAKLYVTRHQWSQAAIEVGHNFAGSAVVFAIVAAIATAVYFDYQSFADRGVAAQVSTVNGRIDLAAEDLNRVSMAKSEVSQSMSNFEDLPTTTFITPLEEELMETGRLLRGIRRVDAPAPDAGRESTQSAVAAASQALDNVNVHQSKANSLLVSSNQLLHLRQRFAELQNSEAYRELERMTPSIRSRAASIKLAFTNADTNSTGAIESAIDLLAKSVTDGPNLQEANRKLDALLGRFAEMHLDSAGAQTIEPLLASAKDAVGQGDLRAATERLDHLTKLADFAERSVTLSIVDRAGVKSGVERNYDPTGGKSWYVIVEALDHAGNAVPVPVRSSEKGGPVQFRPYFGVRIAQELYDTLKAEKKATGHPSKKIMGIKPAKSMAMVYQHTYSTNPEVIVEW